MPNERKLFWHNLEKIKNGLLLNDNEFAKFIGISLSSYTKNKNAQSFLPTPAVYELAEKLNFHFLDLLKNDFQLHYKRHVSGDSRPLPEKYTIAPYSKLTPTRNIISYLEKTRGTQAKINLLRKFQLQESFYHNESNRTNIHLITDIVKYLFQTYQFSEQEFINMGRQTPFSPIGNLISTNLLPYKRPEDLLEVFVNDCAQFFDKNCIYRITNTANSLATVEVLPNKDVMEELKINSAQFGNEEACLTKMGCISSFTWFHFNSCASVKKLTSVYEGSQTNKYIIDLAPYKRLSRTPYADLLEFKAVHH